MTPRFAKVREIADRFRVSVDSVYLWIRQGKIPPDGPALRSALDCPGGRVLTDAECERAGSRLLELVRILREWDQKTKTLPPETGNV